MVTKVKRGRSRKFKSHHENKNEGLDLEKKMAPISLLKSYPIFMKVKITRKIDLLDLNKSHLDKNSTWLKSVTLVFEKSTTIDKNRGLNQKSNWYLQKPPKKFTSISKNNQFYLKKWSLDLGLIFDNIKGLILKMEK